MSSPYPSSVEHGTLEEELHDIEEIRRALSRLESSPNLTLPNCDDTFEQALKESRATLRSEREHTVHKNALLDALKELDDSDDTMTAYDDLAEQALQTIGENSFGEQALVDAFTDQLPYEYAIDDDEAALNRIQTLAEDVAAGHY